MSRVSGVVSTLVAAGLGLVTARRALFVLAATNAPPAPVAPVDRRHLPPITVLVAARDEEVALPRLFESLSRLDYPEDRLEVVVIDDGSSDATATLAAEWVAGGGRRRLLANPVTTGKSRALAVGLAASSTDLVLVYDADERPTADAPARLAAAFADPSLAAVSGRRRVANPETGMWAAYAALEADVHQLVTQRAKDRLGLGPAVLGSNCAYRRSAIVGVGGFRPGALLEDIDLTVRLLRAGHRTRFVADAVSEHPVPTTLRGWWLRRSRWSAGFTDVARDHAVASRSTGRLATDLELVAFTAGYADRTLTALAGLLWLAGRSTRLSRWVLVIATAVASAEAVCALWLARASRTRWRHLATLPLVAPADVAASAYGMVQSVLGRSRWEKRAARGEPVPAR